MIDEREFLGMIVAMQALTVAITVTAIVVYRKAQWLIAYCNDSWLDQAIDKLSELVNKALS